MLGNISTTVYSSTSLVTGLRTKNHSKIRIILNNSVDTTKTMTEHEAIRYVLKKSTIPEDQTPTTRKSPPEKQFPILSA